jgi:hypothetical protein
MLKIFTLEILGEASENRIKEVKACVFQTDYQITGFGLTFLGYFIAV